MMSRYRMPPIRAQDCGENSADATARIGTLSRRGRCGKTGMRRSAGSGGRTAAAQTVSGQRFDTLSRWSAADDNGQHGHPSRGRPNPEIRPAIDSFDPGSSVKRRKPNVPGVANCRHSSVSTGRVLWALESTGSIRTACSKARTPRLQLFRRHRVWRGVVRTTDSVNVSSDSARLRESPRLANRRLLAPAARPRTSAARLTNLLLCSRSLPRIVGTV